MDSDRVLNVLADVAAGIRDIRDPAEILSRIVKALCEVLQCSGAGIWRTDDTHRSFELVASGTDQRLPGRIGYGEGLVGTLIASGVTSTVENGAWSVGDVLLHEAGFVAGLATPLVWRGDLVGVMAAFSDRQGRVFDVRAIQVMELLAAYAAAALSGEQTDRQMTRLRLAVKDEQERLLHLQVAMRQMLDVPEVRANLVEVVEALQALGWQRVILALHAEDAVIEDLIAVGIPDSELQALRNDMVPASVWAALISGDLEEYHQSGMYFLSSRAGEEWQPDDLLFAPLQLRRGRIAGTIRLDGPVDGMRPTPEALRPLDILIGQAAYIVENAHLLEETSRIADTLSEQVDELSMIHRADRELSSHLNVDRVMTLTMDWALRRTGADTGLLMLTTDRSTGLVPSVMMGYVDRTKLDYSEQNPMSLEQNIIGRAVHTRQTQVVRALDPDDPDYLPFIPKSRAHVSVPLAMRGEVLGVISLASSRADAFAEHDVSFVERLARRAAVALDNARLFRQAEQLADDMALLYAAGRTITSTLERSEVLQRIAQSLTAGLECSSSIILDYNAESHELQVLAAYRLGTAQDAHEVLPENRTVIPIAEIPPVERVIERRRPLVLRVNDPAVQEQDRQTMIAANICALLMLPLVSQDELVGMAILFEGRRDRNFTSNDIFKAEMLASQASAALRQSMLYSEVLELEKLKSEMIRMASHDLRNPLNNVLGYIELLSVNLDRSGKTPDQALYIDNLRRSAMAMKILINDLLTLERIESQRQGETYEFDLGGLMFEVVEAAQSSARLKGHFLSLEREPGTGTVVGSITQVRQAAANLVDNAIKYTPEGGRIQTRVYQQARRLCFTVRDNGYGISPERQQRLFERFYRAQEPGTDHIGGTGLGLSLVKTVIERHGGQVWFESQAGQGSTFGFWLPAASNNT